MGYRGYLVFALLLFGGCGRLGFESQEQALESPDGETVCSQCAADESCLVVGDCDPGMCTANGCQAPNCSDGVINQDETDTDCGGSHCGSCNDGAGCLNDADCSSSVCAGNLCQVPSCTDGMQNQDETDIDCGGELRGLSLRWL
ncbi:MAG: hypothetical protein IPJ88_11700 [Myxococcales bacterium]|nr:MAG: hypothetical protein IPJ88_11700 [Myxococcales bacterium]